MNVMIGVDPHKASHTAVAIGMDEGADRQRQGPGHAAPGRAPLVVGRTI